MFQMLLQNAAAVVLQNASKIYFKICQIFYYKMGQFYYKLRWLLQNMIVITKCDVCFKIRRYSNDAIAEICKWLNRRT